MTARTDRLYEHSCRPGSADGVCRSRGGESCAFDGAMIVLQCIADAAHLVHGPIACFGNSWESRGTISDKGGLHLRAYTTDMDEMDIVYGAEKKLLSAIRETSVDSRTKNVFVYSTCVTGLIGEDVGAVCKRAQEMFGINAIPVLAPGFVGPKNLGNRIAGEVLLDHVIGTGEPYHTTPTDINLIGEYNIAGDLKQIEPVFKRAGFNVLSRITGNSTYEEVSHAHRAKLNVVVCGRALINVAKEMERRYGIPYVEVSFFGKTGMTGALRAIAGGLKEAGAGLAERVEKVIKSEEEALDKQLAPYGVLAGKRAVLYTGGVKSWSFISALSDLGLDVVAVGTKKSTAEDEEKMRALMGPDAPLIENTAPANLLKIMKERSADILVAGGRNQYLAIKEGYPFVDVNQERHTAYAGYGGLVNLAREMDSAYRFYNRPAPAAYSPPAAREKEQKNLSVNPLKHSASIGAAIAFQGVDQATAVLHGAQGCNFLGKVLLTKHFREPISMVSTKMFVEDVVMGSLERLETVVSGLAAKNSPEIVGVITTGLAEVKGEDVSIALGRLDDGRTAVVHVAAPDYNGGLEEGYAAAVRSLVELAQPGPTDPGRVNVLAGSHLTPADAAELREIIGDFGLSPVILPDLSALDGSREGFSTLAAGGAKLSEIRSMGTAVMTLVIGPSLSGAAEALFARCGVPYTVFDGLVGLGATDRFFDALSRLSEKPVPARRMRERRMLVDGMRDAMTVFAGRDLALAQETDAALSLSEFVTGMGASVSRCVVPTHTPAAQRIRAGRVIVGDYCDFTKKTELLVAGSHGAQTAGRLGVRHFEWGFPVFERLGVNHLVNIGYRGTLNMVNTIGNELMEVER